MLVVVAAFVEAAPREKRELGGNFGGLQGGRKFGINLFENSYIKCPTIFIKFWNHFKSTDLKTDSQEIKNRQFGPHRPYGEHGYQGGFVGYP